jgi:ATP-dependent Clp protease ATP-binding subunit ClpA
MGYDFTPAAERALEAAAAWTICSDDAELHLPEVLLGLLAEPECRSALLLAQCDVDPQAVHRKFPQLAPAARSPSERLKRFSPELTASLETAEHLLSEYPRPLTLATEHILLGLVARPSCRLASCLWANRRRARARGPPHRRPPAGSATHR